MSGLNDLNLDDILGMLPKSEPTAKNSQLAAKELFAVIDDPMINTQIFKGLEDPEIESMKKSGLMRELAEKAGIEVIDIPFDTLETIDLSGLPKPIKASKNKM